MLIEAFRINQGIEGVQHDACMKVYSFVKERGEVLICNIPSRMMGAVPNLNNRGLVEVYKNSQPSGVQEKEVCESYRAHGDKREGVIRDVSCKFLMHATR